MEDVNLNDQVMVYGFKGVVKYIGKKEYIKRPNGNVVNQLVGVELVKKLPQCTNGNLNGTNLFKSNDETAIFIPLESLKPYDGT